MRYAVEVTGLGSFADAEVVARVARAAEDAGWDGLFIWDHLAWSWGVPSGDPWISLAVAAASTEWLRLGTSVTPLPRRRPQVVATAVTALDRLSGGRVIFGAGLGDPSADFEAFGEAHDAELRSSMLDEGLDLLAQLWSGQQVSHKGAHYTVVSAALSPLPVQRPRPPVWIGGTSAAALARAGRWDGYSAALLDGSGQMVVSPAELAERVTRIGRERPFDVAVSGVSDPGDERLRLGYLEAGATWWLESVSDLRGSLEDMIDRVIAGP